ncbi:hypothetical protein NMY22_g19367 [Coprinellus aureogranulatus]|nr:hypothetical protein NMY22_g19367 [Coprinellus aureogranulatus]
MSSPPNAAPSKDPASLEALSMEELLDAAETGSVPHMRQLRARIPQHFLDHSLRILQLISSHLSISESLDGFEPNGRQITLVVSVLLTLAEVNRWYTAHPGSNNDHSQVATYGEYFKVQDFSHFWALRLLGVPASPESPNPSQQWMPSERRLALYECVAFYYHTMFRTPTDFHKSARWQESFVDAAIALWITLHHGVKTRSAPASSEGVRLFRCPEFYPSGKRGREPDTDQQDQGTGVFYNVALVNSRGIVESLMEGRVCTPEVFVDRTIGRMRSLQDVSCLRHLSHLPTSTIEVSNMRCIVTITHQVMQEDSQMRDLFLREMAPCSYMNVLNDVGKRLETSSKSENQVVAYGTTSTRQETRYMETLLGLAEIVVTWASYSSQSPLRLMRGVISNGAIQLVASGRAVVPESSGHLYDKIFDLCTQYGVYLEIYPILRQTIQEFAMPKFWFDNWNPDFSTPGYPGSRMKDANVDSTRRSLSGMFESAKAASKVTLCDNLEHQVSDRDIVDGRVRHQSKACSRCRMVTYCSVECQREDWIAFHHQECRHMSKVRAETTIANKLYTHGNRQFQSAVMQSTFEKLDRNYPEQVLGRQEVVNVDLLRPVCTSALGVTQFRVQETPFIPQHIGPRCNHYFKLLKEANGAYEGADPDIVRTQTARLICRGFRFGDQDMNVLVLLRRRERHPSFQSAEGANTELKYTIRGVLTYTSFGGRGQTKSRHAGFNYANMEKQ